MRVLKICIPHTARDYFDYSATDSVPVIGARVRVSFRNKKTIGIVIAEGEPECEVDRILPIIDILDEEPLLSPELLQLCHWISQYYHGSLSEVIPLALPKRYRDGHPIIHPIANFPTLPCQLPLDLNYEQATAVETMLMYLDTYHCFLLQGVTGSGKTEVYLHLIAEVLGRGKQALVLVPEIGLTPQLLTRFQSRFACPVIMLHSQLTDSERQTAWSLARDGHAGVVIGTRSAVFTPMPDLGVIVIDEEHDTSLKQMDGVHYSGRDTALMRAFYRSIPIVLGSATPSLESLHNCERKKYTLLPLHHKALSSTQLHYQVMDIRNVILKNGLAQASLALIRAHLDAGNQVLVFINRRGFAPVMLCHACGWTANCSACDSHQTWHRRLKQLICHHCGVTQAVPTRCTGCDSAELVPVGAGTQRIYDYLESLFPDVGMVRVDRDEVSKKDAWDRCLQQIISGEARLIIGTQMLAKGHHFPNVTLVVVLDTDNGFYHHDFRALERLGQLLTQVAGRAGRADRPGHVVIQTHLPHHPLLTTLLQQGYEPFSDALMALRQEAQLPPYTFTAMIRGQAKKQGPLLEALHGLKEHMRLDGIDILGPAPSSLARKAGWYRMQLFVKASSRTHLKIGLQRAHRYVSDNSLARRLRFSIDVDPIEL